MWLLILCISTLILTAIGGGGSPEERNLLLKEISSLRKQINGYVSSNSKVDNQLAQIWGQLGMNLQTYDIIFHQDSAAMQAEADECFVKAFSLSNENKFKVVVRHRHGILLKMMSRGEEAIAMHEWTYKHATSKADRAISLQNKGHALGMLGRVEEAIEAYKLGISTYNRDLGQYISLVDLYVEVGLNQSQWVNLYEELEGKVRSFLNGDLDDDDSDSVLAFDRSGRKIGNDLSSSLYWSLYLIGDKVGDYSRAWGYLERAHEIEKNARTTLQSDAEAIRQTEFIKGVFRKGFWTDPDVSGIGSRSKVPIFIVGMMRSGSTLTETMLDAHSQIWGMGENSVFNNMLPVVRDKIVQATTQDGSGDTKAVAAVVKEYSDDIVKQMLKLAHDEYAAGRTNKTDIKRVVDKMLFNYRNIGFIHMLFPNAVILHTMRDPMDTLFSCYKHKFDDSGLEWSLDVEKLALQYYLYLDIMRHFREHLPNRIIDIQYEQLVENPKEVMQKVIKAAGVAWEGDILNFHSTGRIVHTHSMTQVRQGLYKKSIGSWTKYAHQLKPLRVAMKKYIDILRKEEAKSGLRGSALPFPETLNWDLDDNWSGYDASVRKQENKAFLGKPLVGIPIEEKRSNNRKPTVQKPVKNSKDEKGVRQVHKKSNSGTDRSLSDESSTASSMKKESGKKKVSNDKTKSKSSKSKRKKSEKKKSSKSSKSKSKKSKKEKNSTEKKIKSEKIEKESVKENYKKEVSEKSVKSAKKGVMKKYEVEMNQLMNKLAKKIPGYSLAQMKAYASSLSSKGTGIPLVDEMTALGITLINSNKLADALEIFNYLQKNFNNIASEGEELPPTVLIAHGTILAQTAQFSDSVMLLSKAIRALSKAPNGKATQEALLDAYLRRAEVYFGGFGITSKGDEAISDYTKGLELAKKLGVESKYPQVYLNRGRVWHEKHIHSKALLDFRMADKYNPDDTQVWLMIGRAIKEHADTEGALAALNRSLELDPSNANAIVEKGIALLEVSRWEEATELLYKALKLQPKHKMAWGYLGLMYISMGRHPEALENFEATLKSDPSEVSVMQMAGICLMGEGRFKHAIELFDRAVKTNPTHFSWFNREIAFSQWMNLDLPITSYYPDRLLNPRVQEELSQLKDWHILVNEGYSPLASTKLAQKLRDSCDINVNNGIAGSFVMTPAVKRVLNESYYLRNWIQLTSPGFLPNLRQHKMFGLSALQVAQTLRYQARLLRQGKGLTFPDSMSSNRLYPNDYSYLKDEPDYAKKFAKKVSKKVVDEAITSAESVNDIPISKSEGSYHKMYWRDLMDYVVRWRQLSEPRDMVLWIDRLPFANGTQSLGLSTNLLNGLFKNHRYYPYHDMGISVLKKVLNKNGFFYGAKNFDSVRYLSDEERAAVLSANSVEELYHAVGDRDISILAPCKSIKYPGKMLNGTRVIAGPCEREGWEMLISTPSSLSRYEHFEEELEYVMDVIILPALSDYLSLTDNLAIAKDSKSVAILQEQIKEAKEKVIKGGLIFFFYWVHFAPLSRGTSATGYAAMVSFILSVGEHINDTVPPLKQLDFEGMFRDDPYEFVEAVWPWIQNRAPTTISKEYLEYESGFRLVDIFNSSRSMMSVFISQPGEQGYGRKYIF